LRPDAKISLGGNCSGLKLGENEKLLEQLYAKIECCNLQFEFAHGEESSVIGTKGVGRKIRTDDQRKVCKEKVKYRR
jgi:hypothetical protein